MPAGSRILDAGCGCGNSLPLIHGALDGQCEIVGVDNSEIMLSGAREVVKDQSLGNTTLLRANLLESLPLSDDEFDFVWVSDVMHPSSDFDHVRALGELTRVLKPGGTLAIFHSSWLRPLYLPGHTYLEHALGRARECLYSREEKEPGILWHGANHPERALDWLMDIGLVSCDVSFHTALHQQPLAPTVRGFLEDRLESVYQKSVAAHGREVGMTDDDLQNWKELSDPTGSSYILDQASYYCALFALVSRGVKPLLSQQEDN